MKCWNCIVLIVFYLLEIVYSHKSCGIEYLKKPKRVLVPMENENKRMLKDDKWEPIRIHLDFSYLENNLGKINKTDLIDLKEKVMPKVQDVFQQILKVKRIQGKLKLNAPTCETFPIPETYRTDGVEADIVIFVLIDDSGFFAKNKIEAAAVHCLQHSETKRPIAGYIQFKPELKVTNSTAADYMVWLALHEVSHILVINDSLYEDYIDSSTLLPLGLDRVLTNKMLPNGKKMSLIKTPKVIEKGKKHFGCDNFDGVPLEYNGGAGTAGAHWSKKYMNTDYMIGDSYGENMISEITLALFEDSGWYSAEYELSNLFLWGKNEGCDFFDFNKKCINKNSTNTNYFSNFGKEYCTKFNNPVCSISNTFRGTCRTKLYESDLNEFERYFDNAKIGGSDPLMDKCPIPMEDKGGQNYYGGSCRVGNKETLNSKIEKICPECVCFLSSLTKPVPATKRLRFQQVKEDTNKKSNITNNKMKKLETKEELEQFEERELTPEDLLASCFEYKCEEEQLFVLIEGNKYQCKFGTPLKIDGYNGAVNCPDNKIVCNKKFKCKFGCTEKYDNQKGFTEYPIATK